MKDNMLSRFCGPDDEDDWADACDHDELSCEDGDDDHWNSDLG